MRLEREIGLEGNEAVAGRWIAEHAAGERLRLVEER